MRAIDKVRATIQTLRTENYSMPKQVVDLAIDSLNNKEKVALIRYFIERDPSNTWHTTPESNLRVLQDRVRLCFEGPL